MDLDNCDVLHEGWLTKSPPLETKKQLFNQSLITPKWRRRWFVLRQGGMPGQFLLQYYTDQNAKKQKGTIDLDQCEQVDTGLSYQSGKVHYQYMFDIKTPRRVFYLAADSEQEMAAWVECICQVCGLRTYLTDDQESNVPPSSSNFVSGPYLRLSDCFTGNTRPSITRPTRVPPPVAPPSGRRSPQYQNSPSTTTTITTDLQDASVNCGDDSVFLPSGSPSVTARSTVSTRSTLSSTEPLISRLSNSDSVPSPTLPPGRPPKPQALRSTVEKTPSTPTTVTSLEVSDPVVGVPPPLIDRTLKPERMSITSVDLPGTCPMSSLPPPPQAPGPPPPVERARKPGGPDTPQGMWIPGSDTPQGIWVPGPGCGDMPQGMWIPGEEELEDEEEEELAGLCRENVGDNRNYVGEEEEEQIFFYMPSLQQSTGGKWDPLMIPAIDVLEQQVQYLDLDLPGSQTVERKVDKVGEVVPATVYKTVDFIKTEAFNRTRQKVEEYKYNIKPAGK